MLSRVVAAIALAAALTSGAAILFLRTDFVANNLCTYAVATIEEATAAQVKVARCSVEPEQGKVTIEGLQVGDPGGRISLHVERVFAQVVVRPILQRVRLERLELDYPDLHLELDQAAGSRAETGQCLPDVLDRFEFGRVRVRKASVEVRGSGVRIAIPRAGIAIRGKGRRLAVQLNVRGGTVEALQRKVGLISVQAKGDVDLSGDGAIVLTRGDAIGTEGSAFLTGKLSGLCHPELEAVANVRVDDLAVATSRLVPGLLHGVAGGLAADTTVNFAEGKSRVRGDLRFKGLSLEGYDPGDARLRFEITEAKAKVERLDVPVGRGALQGRVEVNLADPALPLSADLQMRDLELQDLLRKVGTPHSIVVLRASGRAQVKGTLVPVQLGAEASVDLADLAVLDRSYEKRSRAHILFELPRGKLQGAVAIDAAKVVVRRAVIDTGVGEVEVESTLSTDPRGGMQLVAHGEGVSLDDLGGHLAMLPARGRASFDARVSGPYRSLQIEGTAAAQGFRLMDLALGDVSARVRFGFESMRLELEDIRGRKGRSHYGGDVALALGDPQLRTRAHLELPDAYLHDMVELGVDLVPALSRLQDPEAVDGHFAGIVDVEGPIEGPDGTAKLQLDQVALWGEKFDRGTARLSLHGKEPRLEIEDLSLAHGMARVRIGGRFGPDWRLDIDGRTESFDLDDLDMAEAAELAGPLQAKVHVGGVADHPRVDAEAKFTDGMAGEAELGEGDVSLRIDGEEMALRAKIGTHEINAHARLEDDLPYTASASLRMPELAPYAEIFAPDAEIQGGSLAADVELQGALLRWRQSSGTIALSRLRIVKSDMQFENDGPAKLVFGSEGLRIERLALRAPFTTAQLQGGRSRDGKLDVRLSASVDGRVLQGLLGDVEHASGTYLVQAVVGGTTRAPTVLGNLRIEDAAVSLRGLPIAARALNGSISFSQDALVIDALAGKLNNGEARVSGGVEMTHLSPKKIDVQAHIGDVNVRLQDNVAAYLDGDLTLVGPPLEPVLGGNVTVSRMKYTEDLDLERSLLDFSRRPPAPRVLARSPMLVHFDLDVHLSRGVRVENNLARTDLKGDLKVTGTSRSLGLLGSINTVHGTATFRGNEFQIEQGVLTFTDRQRIRPSFDFEASAQVKEYKVRLHAFGTPAEPRVALSSEPALAEADLGFLLTFGFVSQKLQQSTFSAADSGLAIGIEALNKATGFSEEVRRFIPKNAILRDPNIDFASDFSVATNRLEPMARFHSHLVSDRLELKVLEGLTSRRYRGMVSYQLSDGLSTRLQLDNEHATLGNDFGGDLYFRWEGE